MVQGLVRIIKGRYEITCYRKIEGEEVIGNHFMNSGLSESEESALYRRDDIHSAPSGLR